MEEAFEMTKRKDITPAPETLEAYTETIPLRGQKGHLFLAPEWNGLLVTMTHKMLFDESSVFGADHHEMHHIARVLVASHTFHPNWPYRDQVKAALANCFHFQG